MPILHSQINRIVQAFRKCQALRDKFSELKNVLQDVAKGVVAAAARHKAREPTLFANVLMLFSRCWLTFLGN